ncbi:MAG: LruC domain-containing protein [Lacibacter sp.]
MKTLLLPLALCLIISCNKHSDTAPPLTGATADVDSLIKTNAPSSFNFVTDRDVSIDITILSPDEVALPQVNVNLLDAPEEAGGKVLFTALTDAAGKITGNIKLPGSFSTVIVDPAFVGVMRNAVVSITNNAVSCTLGGKTAFAGNVIPASVKGPASSENNSFTSRIQSVYKYLGTYGNQGKPNNLVLPNDVISSSLLTFVNASLPEQKPVPTYHPEYLRNTAEMNLNITDLSDVWVTFLHEGAGYLNSVAYFKYPTGIPPQTTADIDTLFMVFPNASLSGSGGGLVAGNKIWLGRFEPGTSIGFALITNGWNGTAVSATAPIVYSIDQLNAETAIADKRHTILLYDDTHDLFLIGFEDMNRNPSYSSDNDFNDCVFYASSNPVTAISTMNVNPIDEPGDTDGDGVSDVYDKFPTDPTKAYINYFPAENTYGTLAFEDNWPYMGDYDFNDLVIKYRYEIINNAANKTVELNAKFATVAAGAKMKNGFAVEFPFAASKVKNVTGTRINGSITSFAANGCESGSTKAIFMAFDDVFPVMQTNGMFNTFMAQSFIKPDTINMKMSFTSPLTAAELGVAPFNPFLIANQTRGREVHLAGYTPTVKATTSLLGTGHDNTKPAQNIYYKTISNLPFALAFVEDFNYPVELKTIHLSYTTFIDWAKSGATTNKDWYKNTQFMNMSNIYKK